MAEKFTHRLPLRFSDTDAMGHVNHARFLSFLEDARVAFLVRLGSSSAFSPSLIVARVEIDYVRPIMLSDELVKIDLWVSAIGTKSFTIDYEVTHNLEIVARAKSVIVAFDYVMQRSQVLPEDDKRALEVYYKASPIHERS